MTGRARAVRDAFAVQDALSLGLELTRARASASLDPRLRPTLDDLASRLVEVRSERGLDDALAGLAPLLDALSAWLPPRADRHAAPAGQVPALSGPPSWDDARILRFAAALGVLRALQHGPHEAGGRTLAAVAVDLGRRADLAAPRPVLQGPPDSRGHARPPVPPPAAARRGGRATPSCAWQRRSRAT
jgi:hypothetical protein